MSIYNKEQFTEGIPSQFSLFYLAPFQTAVSDKHNEKIGPLSQLSGDGPIEFRVSGSNSLSYLDLACCKL